MSDTIGIRLSADALDRLFPEGTQARLDLQQSVIAEAARRFAKGALSDEMREHITKLVAEIDRATSAEQLVLEFFGKRNNWNDLRVAIPSKAASAIAEHAREHFRTEMGDMIHGAVQKAADEVRQYAGKRIEQAIERITQEVDASVEKQLNEHSRAEVKRKIEAAWFQVAAELRKEEKA